MQIFTLKNLQKELLAELVEALFKNGRRYNLLNSAILETFKYIKDENIKSLIHYLIDNHWAKLKLIKYSNLFEQMKEKHDQNRAHQVNNEFCITVNCPIKGPSSKKMK